MIATRVGESIPKNTEHAVSVCLPKWADVVGYEEGDERVIGSLTTGYPRFFIHKSVRRLCDLIAEQYAMKDEICLCFPSYLVAKRCREYIMVKSANVESKCKKIRILQLATPRESTEAETNTPECKIAAVFFPQELFPLAKQYWQHSGEILSSRLAEYVVERLFPQVAQEDDEATKVNKNFIETRYGRNLDFAFAGRAKDILRNRIAHKVVETDDKDVATNVFLYPSGMASIFTAHRLLLNYDHVRVKRLKTIGDVPEPIGYGEPYLKTVMFGFPYTDTLSILKKFNHTYFLGMGDSSAMEELIKILTSGEQILGVFMEAPSNPLLKMGDIVRLKELSEKYGFFIVIDETVSGFVNIDVLPYCDIVCSSLTKIFSGDSNVIAGSMVVNPTSRIHDFAVSFLNDRNKNEDLLWYEDAIYLERNSRDFVERAKKINSITEDLLSKILLKEESSEGLFEKVYFPNITSEETKSNYDRVKLKDGGYGGLISLVFKEEMSARAFYDNLDLNKGPSLGTNFTLVCPYTILAHYAEMDDVAQYGVVKNLVRISVGLETFEELQRIFDKALTAARSASKN
ncbi:Cystathionine gamma-synthase [Nakaseomyces bracarensis]|uniref:Cystathionine gamma-synthase n=1 Tax=Nakaseomyces bracarensis TaxID=273131 RepID=A0ABR4NSX1_9SACH